MHALRSVETGMTAVKAGDKTADKSITAVGSIPRPTGKIDSMYVIDCTLLVLSEGHPSHDWNCPKPLILSLIRGLAKCHTAFA